MPPQPPPASVPGQGQQPPFGVSSATSPTPNRGLEAAGLQKLGSVVKQLEELIPMFGAASEPGKACLDALNKLVKMVPSGSVTPASERNNLEQQMQRNSQANQQMMALKQQQAQGAQPGAGGPPGAGAAGMKAA